MIRKSADFDILLDSRSQQVLKSIVHEYLKDGDPVGSRTLSKISRMNLSPASLRNVMADLEGIGLLSSVHTSSGRIPTAKGLRLYISSLATLKPPPKNVIDNLKRNLNVETTTSLLDSANKTISQMTSFASLIAISNSREHRIKRIQFLKLSEKRLLLVIVTLDGNVINSVLSPEGEFSESELTATANYFNRNFKGKTFSEASELLGRQLKRLYQRIRKSIRLLQTSLDDLQNKHTEKEERLLISGTENLLRHHEHGKEMDKLRDLLNTLESRKGFRKILENCNNAQEVQIFIGDECGFRSFSDLSMISLSLKENEKPLGMLGVIGPKWMKYGQVIPIIKVTAQMIGESLHQIKSEYE